MSVGDYVECVGCHRRWVGGDFHSRMERFKRHDCPTPPVLQPQKVLPQHKAEA